MLDAKQRAEIDQAMAAMVEMFPPLWRRLYEGCKAEGFSEVDSLSLLKTYILSQCRNVPMG